MNTLRETAYFGTGGNPRNFYDEKYKSTVDIFKWLKDKNLDSYEYQAGNGLYAGMETLKKIGENAKNNNILVSLHAPYFISLTSRNEEINEKSISHVLNCILGAFYMNAYIIVVHTGSVQKGQRSDALEAAKRTIDKTLEKLYSIGEIRIQIGLETMGKENQLGTLEEVIELCRMDKNLYPVVDFGHLNARSIGSRFKHEGDYFEVFEKIGESLGDEKAKYLHCHFSKIEYTAKGEKKHLTFEDKTYGPEFEQLGIVLAKHNLCPNIICESDGTMDLDALSMKELYGSAKKNV